MPWCPALHPHVASFSFLLPYFRSISLLGSQLLCRFFFFLRAHSPQLRLAWSKLRLSSGTWLTCTYQENRLLLPLNCVYMHFFATCYDLLLTPNMYIIVFLVNVSGIKRQLVSHLGKPNQTPLHHESSLFYCYFKLRALIFLTQLKCAAVYALTNQTYFFDSASRVLEAYPRFSQPACLCQSVPAVRYTL